MNADQARRAIETLEDVFTSEDDVVVIDRLHTFSTPGHPLAGKGQCARGSGGVHYQEWFPIAQLTAKEDL